MPFTVARLRGASALTLSAPPRARSLASARASLDSSRLTFAALALRAPGLRIVTVTENDWPADTVAGTPAGLATFTAAAAAASAPNAAAMATSSPTATLRPCVVFIRSPYRAVFAVRKRGDRRPGAHQGFP